MIVNDPALCTNWLDYGILIPFPPDRPKAILDFLETSAVDMPRNKIFITRSDVERVHSRAYCAELFGDAVVGGAASTEKSLQKIYELVDEAGNPNRYDKSIAKRPLAKMFDEMVMARLAGTYFSALAALESPDGFCYYLSGGNHHARYNEGAGFCVFNDMMIAARKLQAQKKVNRIWILDVDAHKGCGTAELNHRIKDSSIFTLSAHMAHGWPLDAQTLASALPGHAPLIPSDVDVLIERGEESVYVSKLKDGLLELEKKSNCDFAIVVDGSDPYEYDELESSSLLKLSLTQCVERDMVIYDFLRARNTKSLWVLSGGYGKRAWEPHAHFLRALQK